MSRRSAAQWSPLADRWWTRRRRTSRNFATCAADADGVLTARAPITRRVIEAMQRCRIIVRYGIGVDTVDIPAATERGIMVANVPDYCIDEVSDHALTLLLMLSRQMIPAIALARQDRWVMTNFPPLHACAVRFAACSDAEKSGRFSPAK